MQVIHPSRDGRTEVTGGQVPVGNPVVMGQQGAVEGLHCIGIGKIDGAGAVVIDKDVGSQLGSSQAERRKVVTRLMAITGVKSGFAVARLGATG